MVFPSAYNHHPIEFNLILLFVFFGCLLLGDLVDLCTFRDAKNINFSGKIYILDLIE